MALNFKSLANSMISAATREAGEAWANIKSVATMQLRNLAHHIAEIAQGLADQTIDQQTALDLMAMARNNAIAMIAMVTIMVVAAVQRIINAALDAIRAAVNSAVSFALIP